MPRHVVLDQSGYLNWKKDAGALVKHYLSPEGPLAVIATSEHIFDLNRFAFPEIDIRRVQPSISLRFSPRSTEPPRRIVYMPRRGEADARMALSILKARGRISGWEIRALNGLTQDEVARELRDATIFLATSEREGLGMPPLEAMASGCFVVGYHAIGGTEFMRPEFSTAVGVGDGLQLVRSLESAIVREEEDPGWLRRRGLEAAKFVRDRYTPERERADVIAAYADLI